MERATKLLVLGWACAALAAQLWLLRGAWPGLMTLAPAVFVIAALPVAFDRRFVALVLIFTYIFPALIKVLHGQYHVDFAVLWMAALLGAMVPDAVRTPWHIPARWRAPLVCWAFVIAVSAVIVVLREMDFYPPTLYMDHMASNSGGGGGPAFVSLWVLHVALGLTIGILWFDWLFGATGLNFVKWIAAPLAASCAVLATVALYQALGDLSFLNETIYGGMGRAAGTVFDGNVAGTVAALWVGGALLGVQPLKRGRLPIGMAGAALAWSAVWVTGSRTAFGLAAIISGSGVIAVWVGRDSLRTQITLREWLVFGAGVLALALLVANLDLTVTGPVQRLSDAARESFRASALEMWNRNRYGAVATSMIREYPWFGVGIGSFHVLVSDFALLSSGTGLTPDNAQSWYRHHFAELGLIGSLAWMGWVAAFAAFVSKRQRDAPAVLWIGRGMLLGFALISLVGMPAQDVSVSITFWTVAFWFVRLAGRPQPHRTLPVRSWLSVTMLVAVFAMGTAHAATNRLRPALRAQEVGWPYSYGFYAPEADGSGGEQRWTGRRAVAVIQAPERRMELTIWVNHVDIVAKPVHARVWRDGELIIDVRLGGTQPVTRQVLLRPNEQWVLIETRVDRAVKPRDFGGSDDRELGLLTKWRFVRHEPGEPPPTP